MKILTPLFVLLLIVAATYPALHVGFLADDFYMGDRIVRAEEKSPGLWAAVHDAFTLQWTDSFDVFRPLTILSLRLDYWLFGANPTLHHAQNILLWVLFAFAVGATVPRFVRLPFPHLQLVVTALVGVWPAGIESVGWLVAREDLFCGIFAVLALCSYRSHRPIAQALAVSLALCSKETAVVLPPLLLFSDFLLGRDHQARVSHSLIGRLARQHAPSIGVLVIYFAVRLILFGSVGGRYNQDSYFSYLSVDGAIVRTITDVASSLLVLLSPVNRDAFFRISNWPESVPAILTLAPLGALLILGLARPTVRGVRMALLILAWSTAPLLLLCVPLGAVYENLEKSRMLVLPLVAWGMGIAFLLNNAWARYRRATIVTVLALLIVGVAAFRLNFTSYHGATNRVNAVLAQIREHTQAGSRTLILNGEHPSFGAGVHPSLTFLEGCHVLSAGLFHATRPPFESAPGRHLEPVPASQFSNLLSIIGGGPRLSRPNILRFQYLDTGPRIEPLAKAGHFGTPPEVHPGHGTRITSNWIPRFEVALSSHQAKSFSHGSIHIFEPGGARGIAEFRRGEPNVNVLVDSEPSLILDSPTFHLTSADGSFRSPLTETVLAHLPHRMLLWWVECYSGSGLVLRTPYSLVFIDPES